MKLTDLHDALRKLPRSAEFRLFGQGDEQRAVLGPLLEQLGVQPIQVDDITSVLGLSQGHVFAVRWDLTAGETGFRQPVLASLLLFQLWRRSASPSNVRVLIDGGSVNTALALSDLATRLGLRADHVLSRHFPEDIRRYLRKHGQGVLTLIEAPFSPVGKEREFYLYLVKIMRDPTRRPTSLCLWHAKYSGFAMRWFGEALAESWNIVPDDIVLGLGSGSTLAGFAIPLKDRFGAKPRIVVAEHRESRLVCAAPMVANLAGMPGNPSRFSKEFRLPPAAVPHAVLGLHYDDLNPFLPVNDLAQIDAVVRYSDAVWQDTSHWCRLAGMPIGNSSAANLAVARYLASEGRTVFTFIYEPLREFYLERQAGEQFSPEPSAINDPIGINTAVMARRAGSSR